MELSVIDCGSLGAVHTSVVASIGQEVSSIDVDERKIASISTTETRFFEPGLPRIHAEGIHLGGYGSPPTSLSAELVADTILIGGRNCHDEAWRAACWSYYDIGRP